MVVSRYMQRLPDPKPAIGAKKKAEAAAQPPDGPYAALLESLTPKQRHEVLSAAAGRIARDLAADLVHSALASAGKSLRQLRQESGIEPAVVSRVATGANAGGPQLSTLVQIGLSLGKTLRISFEDPLPDDD